MIAFLFTLIFITFFILSYIGFAFCLKDNKKVPALLKQPAMLFPVMGFFGCLAVWLATPEQYDALFSVSAAPMLCAFASAFVLYSLSSYLSSDLKAFLFLLVLCGLNILLLPDGFSLTGGLIPVWSERLLLVLAWTLFAFLYDTMNGSDSMLGLQSLTLNIGMVLLYIIGLLPALYGGYACCFTAVFLAFNFFSTYPAKITLNTSACRMVGFLLGWMALLAAVEGDGSCILIICMYYIYETVTAFLKKITGPVRLRKLSTHTFYNLLSAAGIPPRGICELTARINIVLILLAGFQIYAPNNYTVPLISFFMVFWLTSRVTSSDESSRHILLTGSLLAFLRKNGKNKENKH